MKSLTEFVEYKDGIWRIEAFLEGKYYIYSIYKRVRMIKIGKIKISVNDKRPGRIIVRDVMIEFLKHYDEGHNFI